MKREDWRWMEADFSFAPTTGTATYSPTDVGLTDCGQLEARHVPQLRNLCRAARPTF